MAVNQRAAILIFSVTASYLIIQGNCDGWNTGIKGLFWKASNAEALQIRVLPATRFGNASIDTSNNNITHPEIDQEDSPISWQDYPGLWNVSSGRRTCILFAGAIQFDINYYQTDGQEYTARINIPASLTNSTGSCAQRAQFITLSWPISMPNGSIAQGSLRFIFLDYYQAHQSVEEKEEESSGPNFYAISNIRIRYPAAGLPRAKNPREVLRVEERMNEFITPKKNSYQCHLVELIGFRFRFILRMANFQYQAFMNTSSGSAKFTEPILCKSAPVSPRASTSKLVLAMAVAAGYISIALFIYWNKTYDMYEDREDYED